MSAPIVVQDVSDPEPESAGPETATAPEPPPEEEAAVVVVEPPRPKPRSKPQNKAMPAKPAPANTLAEELRRLQQVRAALRGDSPAQARSLIESHRRDYPNSTLARERDASEVAALCAEHRDADAKRKAAAFAKAYPGSSQDLLADCDG